MSAATQLNDKERPKYQSYPLLGLRIDAVEIPQLVALCRAHIERHDAPSYVVFNGMHPTVESTLNPKMKKACLEATYLVPDGMPLVWMARINGIAMQRRCYGPEFLEEFCKATGPNMRHYFYGSTPEVLSKLTASLESRFGIKVAGSFSPPFRSMSEHETAQALKVINDAKPDVVWVGLGAPKQEIWINEHLHLLQAPIVAAVGAAFDFHAQTKPQAPRWMREHGLEWFFRLSTEPRRLAKRYVVYGTRFAFLLLKYEVPKILKRKFS